jgi:hypothetical protein
VRERVHALGGTVNVQSAPAKGTTLQVRLPLVDPVGAARERERAAQLDTLLERARQAIRFAANAVGLVMLFLLLGVPFVAVALGLMATAGGLLWARHARAQLALSLGGRYAPLRRLHHEELAVLPVLLVLCGLSAWYLPVAAHALWSVESAWVTAMTLWLACILLALTAFVVWYRASDRYYGQLSVTELRRAMYGRLRSYVNGAGLWLLVVVLAAVFQRYHPALPPQTAGQWSDAAAVALLVFFPLAVILAYVQTVPWNRRVLRVEVAHAAHDTPDAGNSEDAWSGHER